MHRLNFCGSLCLSKAIEGHKARGMNIVHSFPEAHIIPMAGAATPMHVLYVPKAIHHPLDGANTYLEPAFLDQPDRLPGIIAGNHWIAPDCALDTSKLADISFANRDKSLKQIADRLFSAGHERVVIWANNGIGPDLKDGRNGILRDTEGIACAMSLDGERFSQYKEGLAGSYQNSAHAHIHIAPTTREGGFDRLLSATLDSLHKTKTIAGLNEYRQMAREQLDALPCISVCVVDSKQSLGNDLSFTHYSTPYTLAGLARTLVANHSGLVQGIDMASEPVRKEHIQRTADAYRTLLA